MSKVLAQWEKRKTAIQKSKVRFAVLTALMKMVSKSKAKGKKKDTKTIAEIIGKYMYSAFPTKTARSVYPALETLIGTVLSVNNDVLYSFGSGYFFIIYEISENGYKRFFDIIKSRQYNSINETVAFQKQELDLGGQIFIKRNQGLQLFSFLNDALNNYFSYFTSEHIVETLDVNETISFITNNKDITLSVIDNKLNIINNLHFLNLLKIYSSLKIKKISIKYPIRLLNERMTFLSGIDANGYTLRCGIMPKEKGVLKGYRNDNKDWIEVKDVLFFDGEWSVVPRSKFED